MTIEDSNDFSKIAIPATSVDQYPTPKMRSIFINIKTKETSGTSKVKYLSSLITYEIGIDCDKATSKDNGSTRFFTIYPFNENGNRKVATDLSKSTFGKGFGYFNSEKSCLEEFARYLKESDPDFIIGHDIENDLRFLLNSMVKNNVPEISVFGRYKFDQSKMKAIKSQEFLGRLTFGRLVLDTHAGAIEFKREVDYDVRYLGKKYFEIKFDDLTESNDNTFQTHQREIDYQFREIATSVKLNEKIQNLQLTKQLTNVGGCLWSHSLRGQRAIRVEYLLMRKFFKSNYIIPDKIRLWEGPGGDKHKGAKYEGGYVLEPKVGLHQNYTLLLDFKSLYPSIIRRYNLCFTTVQRDFVPMKFYTDARVRQEIIEKSPDPGIMVTRHNPPSLSKKEAEEKGTYILPYILEELVEKRDSIKKEMKYTKKTPTQTSEQRK